MQYFATIYVDTLFEKELLKNVEFSLIMKGDLAQATRQIDFTHAFLGLTKGKLPDELDKIKLERDVKYWDYSLGKMVAFRKEEYKWYETMDTNEYNDGFWGFGTANGDLGIIGKAVGKVFQYNQYVVIPNKDKNIYDNAKLRSSNTFSPSNRCTLELSQEQYEFLLDEIKKDFEATKDIRPQSLEPINEEFTYGIHSNNCVHWVIKKLSTIGIELVDEKYTIPGNFINIFKPIQAIHSTFLKFQNIDDNLKSIKGAIAFRDWARKYINNSCLSQVYFEQYNKERGKDSLFLDKEIMQSIFHLSFVYLTLDKILQSRLDKINNKKIKGYFELIYYEQQEQQLKILKASNGYKAEPIKEFDLSVPANNCSLNKFYPFIFIPKDTMISKVLYHKYDYGKVSNGYERAMNEFYKNVIAEIQSDKYWSKSYHKMNKNLEKLNV